MSSGILNFVRENWFFVDNYDVDRHTLFRFDIFLFIYRRC